MEPYGLPEPIPGERVTAVGKEMHLDLGEGMTATLLHTPGHAPHQLSVLLDRSRTLLTADAVGIVYPGMKEMIPTTPPPSFDPKVLVTTVEQLGQADPSSLLVPHFGVRNDSDFVFESTKSKVTDWVQKVGEMRRKKKSLGEISEEMVARVMNEEGAAELPVYARVAIRTSVMGILSYLEKNV